MTSSTAFNKRWVAAPNTFGRYPQTTGSIQGVWLSDREEVEWHIQYNPDGSQTVTGYTITTKPINGVVDVSGIEI